MGKMQIMGSSGHTEVKWDANDKESLETAEGRFNELRKVGYLGFRTAPGPAEMLRGFDPQAENIVMAVPLQGG